MPNPKLPGAEPPGAVAAMMLHATATIELTSLFIGSSAARRAATDRGARYLAMPGVRLDTFRPGGPLAVDFERLRIDAERVGAAWDRASEFRLTSRGGTDLRGSVEDRPGRVLHGMARDPGAYMAPPDVESGTAPVEGSATGVVVVDADLLFMGEGPLDEPVVLHVAEGRLTGIEGAERGRGRLLSMLERCQDDRMANIAEVSVAFNPAGSGLLGADGDRVVARVRAHRAGQLDRLRRPGERCRAPGLRDAGRRAGTRRPRGDGRRSTVMTGPRILLAKPGLDGHDRGIKVIAFALREAGAEVIYLGLRQSPAAIVAAAIAEDADLIGISVLSGAHLPLAGQIMAQRAERGGEHIPVAIGGIIPAEHVGRLREMGVDAVYPVGSQLPDVVVGLLALATGQVAGTHSGPPAGKQAAS